MIAGLLFFAVRALVLCLFIPVALLELMAIYDSFFPFSDEAIRASPVDTWQPAAIVTDLALKFIGVVALVAVFILVAVPQVRKLAAGLLLLCLASAAHLAINQHHLDQRTRDLWGGSAQGSGGISPEPNRSD